MFFITKEKKFSDKTAEARTTQSCSLWGKKPHSQKERQDEKAEGYVPDEGTR